jgi:hypothetical protein
MKSFILLLESINNKFLIYFVHYIQQKKNNIVWTFFKQLKNIACEPVTKKKGTPRTPTGIRLTSLDSITSTPRHELSAVSLTCYNSRITVQNHTMQLPITQMVRPNLMSHNTKTIRPVTSDEHLQCSCTAIIHHGQTPFDFTNQLLVFYFTENTPTA